MNGVTHVSQWTPSDWIAVVQFLGIVLLGVAAWWLKAHFVSKGDYHALGERVDNHATRLTLGDQRFKELEDKIAALPTQLALAELTLRMERLSGDMRVLTERIEGASNLNAVVKRQVERIDEFLRKAP
jgi:hypothetical protein